MKYSVLEHFKRIVIKITAFTSNTTDRQLYSLRTPDGVPTRTSVKVFAAAAASLINPDLIKVLSMIKQAQIQNLYS